MFENAINELDAMGVAYEETEDGGLIIDIETVDKTDLITIIGFLNDNGLMYEIDATAITIMGDGGVEKEPTPEAEPAPEGFPLPEDMEL